MSAAQAEQLLEWPLGETLHWTMRACFGGAPRSWALGPHEHEVYRLGGGTLVDQFLVSLRRRPAT